MSNDTDTKVKSFMDMSDSDTDLSDIPEMTRERLSHCLIRFPNKPMGYGGEWHKPVLTEQMSDERLEELKARAKYDWEATEGQHSFAQPKTLTLHSFG